MKEHVGANFEGECVQFCDENLQRCTDLRRVRKIYKLNPPASIMSKKIKEDFDHPKSIEIEEVKARTELEISILGLMALRGAT